MSRQVLIHHVDKILNSKPEEISNVQELTDKQLYEIIQHERLHAAYGGVERKRKTIPIPVDNVLNNVLLK